MTATKILVALILTLVCQVNAVAAAPGGKCFKVFNGLLFAGMPKSVSDKLEPITIYDAFRWWGPGDSRELLPSSGNLESWIKSAKSNRAKTLVVDLEAWPTSGPLASSTASRLNALVERLRKGGVTEEIGFYGLPPIRDYWRAVKPANHDQYKVWQAANEVLTAVADKVDALFPSLYTFYDDQAGWEKYARANVAEARRLAKGKPVYPFIWMFYHESSATLGGKLIPEVYWRRQLEVLAEVADGVVVWGGYQSNWDENAAWWRATQSFMNDHPVCKSEAAPLPPVLTVEKSVNR